MVTYFQKIFKYISLIFSKKELNYGLDEAGNEIEVYPSVFISENGNEYNCLTYDSIWYPLELKLLFKDDLVDNANYSITIVDYLKIYKFNVIISIILIIVLFSFYAYAEYDRNKNDDI